MTAKINKDVTEDAEETDVVEEETPKPAAKKKVRRVRVIEVIEDEDDDDEDLSGVLEALDQADEEADDEPAPVKSKAVKAKAAKVAEAETAEDAEEADEPVDKAAPKPKAPSAAGERTILGASPVVAGVVIVLVAALATLSLFLWRSQSNLAAKEDTRQEIEKRVTEYGNAVLSIDRNNLQGSFDRMRSFMTGDVLAEAKKSDIVTLKASLDKNGISFVSKTRAVHIGNVSGKFASATLIFDLTVQSATAPQTVVGNHVKLDLVKQDGKWMISKQAGAGRESDSAAGGGVPGLGGTNPSPSTSPSASTSGKPKQ